jgi:hypothetical protein
MADQPGMQVPVTELRVGDLIDLEGDPYADRGHGDPGHHCPFQDELVEVGDIDGQAPGELETPGCYRLDYEGGACGFPPGHLITRAQPPAGTNTYETPRPESGD